ncbi:cupin domain-containing protein [Kribbella jiaozuonensis]|uniref:Cupin domain-containing protein n=1 Tax=Kribbella jiaozuonensis TaxID=2575441 RepID=A0A4U3LFZ8_9ACTN|nr:cupin domain-containing protein [Kribbella jiaozuonensis]
MPENRFMEKPELATLLDLEAHPEGGWYRETWRSGVEFEPEGYDGVRASATAIYFLLAPGEESRLHRVRSAEIWLWHSGGPLTLEYDDESVVLGPDVQAGQQPQVVIPPGAWQAARPAGDEAVLVSCIVSPGFDFADFTMQ